MALPPDEAEARDMTWQLLEHIIRNAHEFRELYVREGIDSITVGGHEISVHHLWDDIIPAINELPEQRSKAVRLMVLEHKVGREAMDEMGLGSATTISNYKRYGMIELCERFFADKEPDVQQTEAETF